MKELEEENKPKEHEFILTNPDWLDLPEPIATNIILEHLEIIDYIRFSAVCKKWQSIQKEHRILYSPYPPPLPLSFPWLRCIPEYKQDGILCIPFHLPDKQKSYRIPILNIFDRVSRFHCHGHGCLLLLDVTSYYQPVVYISNPITGVLIKLPPCSGRLNSIRTGCISCPLTDPDGTILIVDRVGSIYLYHLNDYNGWKKIGRDPRRGSRFIFCDNKIYFMTFDRDFYTIDTLLPDPVMQMIEMDWSEINVAGLQFNRFDLVNFFGEIVMIIIVFEDSVGHSDYDTIKEFHVYKADFLRNKWMRMVTLGDRVLFYSLDSIFASSAIDVGCKKNTIYSAGGLKGRGVAWRAFDISTRDWIDGPPLSLPSNEFYLNRHWSWFLPTPEYINIAETNGAR